MPAFKTTVEPHLSTTPLHFKRLLLATDFSIHNQHALELSANLARCYDADLLVAYVIWPVPDPGVEFADERWSVPKPVKQRMDDFLSHCSLSDVRADRRFIYATPMADLADAIEAEGADLVICSTSGRTGLPKLVLGSSAEALCRKSVAPVLTISPAARSSVVPFRRILFATGLEPHEMRAAQYASSLAEQEYAHIRLLHVLQKDGNLTARREEALAEMEALMPSDIREWCHPFFDVEVGDPAERVVHAANAFQSDLIVIGIKHGLLASHSLGATASKILRAAPCPVLAVRQL